MRGQDVENHFIGNGFSDFRADVVAIGCVPVFTLCPGHFDDPALDDVGVVALNQPVYHPGASDQPDLTDGQWQQRTLYTLVQFTAEIAPPGAESFGNPISS